MLTTAQVAGQATSGDIIVVASMSGGKDSTAMSLWLTEQGIPHRRVFADTGWEAPVTYAYLAYLRERLGPIDVVRNESLWTDALPGEAGMLTLVRKKQMFPSRVRRFCTEKLKLDPLKKYMEEVGKDAPVVNTVGIRAEESRDRAGLPEWEYDPGFGLDVWRPLIAWAEAEVIEIHHRNGVKPNPLYMGSAKRVGCYPCVFASKDEIASLPQERVDQIGVVERDLTADAVSRGVERSGRGFFHLKRDPLTGEGGFVPIEQVRAWARTSRGGKQLQMLETADPGCMRWGLCDTTGKRE